MCFGRLGVLEIGRRKVKRARDFCLQVLALQELPSHFTPFYSPTMKLIASSLLVFIALSNGISGISADTVAVGRYAGLSCHHT